uniref:GST N-terminal domain-containing protein n=1 Tax=Tetranychus urticae TaxID=32264 RepID=T1JQA3_TETUR
MLLSSLLYISLRIIKMVIELYQLPYSAPCLQVRMVGKILNIPIETKHLDLEKGEHLKPEYLKSIEYLCCFNLDLKVKFHWYKF